MIIAKTIQQVRDQVRAWKEAGQSIGLCPTKIGRAHV